MTDLEGSSHKVQSAFV